MLFPLSSKGAKFSDSVTLHLSSFVWTFKITCNDSWPDSLILVRCCGQLQLFQGKLVRWLLDYFKSTKITAKVSSKDIVVIQVWTSLIIEKKIVDYPNDHKLFNESSYRLMLVCKFCSLIPLCTRLASSFARSWSWSSFHHPWLLSSGMALNTVEIHVWIISYF